MNEDPFEILKKQEPLDPELEEYKKKLDFGFVIQHPLVFSVPHMDGMNAFVNAQLRQKQAALERAKNEQDWDAYIWLHERPFRFEAFWQINEHLNDKQYWETLGGVWVDTENLWQHKDFIHQLLCPEDRDLSLRVHMMDDQDLRTYRTLPDRLVVYRGCSRLNREGWSWTRSRERAEWFSRRYGRKDKLVLEARVSKDQIIAYFNSRHEQEVVLDPEEIEYENSEG